jgi:selenocysteine-specific elongation factor
MPHLLIGTAGHVDHGKTRLIEALTGIDCDRWREEKERGITIDLGFAHLMEGDLQIGFVDVPGHAKFLHNALAGLGGIRLVLLVVAADEGVKPQTREHVDICRLLEIPHAVVVLTKADLVEADLLELAREEVHDFLASGPYADAPIHVVSSHSGDGIDVLRDRLIERARALGIEGDDGLPPRLPIDRAFQLQGRGTIVTGTLLSGTLTTGMELEWGPGGGLTRIRSMQVHGDPRDNATAGERVALQLAGVSVDQLSRGVQLFAPGALEATTHLVARVTVLPGATISTTGWTDVVVHAFTAEVPARLRPVRDASSTGKTNLVEIRTRRPILVTRGDHLIIRRPSPPTTLGGGRILDPFWRRRRGSRLEHAVQALQKDSDAVVFWVDESGPAGRSATELAHREGRLEAAAAAKLETLAETGRLVELGTGDGRRWITPTTEEAVRHRAQSVLAAHFRRHRLATGLSRAEAAERILGKRARGLAEAYFGRLARDGVLVEQGESVDLPGREDPLTGEESELTSTIRRRFEEGGLAPPSPADLRRELGAKPQIVDGLIGYLLERGRLVRLPGGLILAATAVQELRRDLIESELTTFSVADFKSRYGLSRKWAIPLLEHLDSTGTTRRMGDKRVIARGQRGES